MISVLLDHVLDLENLVQDLPSPVLHPDPYQGQDPDRNQNLCPDLDLDQAMATRPAIFVEDEHTDI